MPEFTLPIRSATYTVHGYEFVSQIDKNIASHPSHVVSNESILSLLLIDLQQPVYVECL